MPQDFILRGVPMALQTDAWWLIDPAPTAPQPATTGGRRPVVALLALLMLADLLFWHQTPGLSLAVFAAALFAATLSRRPSAKALCLLWLSVLPVVDYVQPLSAAILALGLPSAVALNRGVAVLPALISLLRRLPSGAARELSPYTAPPAPPARPQPRPQLGLSAGGHADPAVPAGPGEPGPVRLDHHPDQPAAGPRGSDPARPVLDRPRPFALAPG